MNGLMDRWVSWVLERETRPPDWTNALAAVVLMVVLIGPSIAAAWFPARDRWMFDLPAYALAGFGIGHLSGLQRRRAYARGLHDGALEAYDDIARKWKQESWRP